MGRVQRNSGGIVGVPGPDNAMQSLTQKQSLSVQVPSTYSGSVTQVRPAESSMHSSSVEENLYWQLLATHTQPLTVHLGAE